MVKKDMTCKQPIRLVEALWQKKQGTAGEQEVRNKNIFLGLSTGGTGKYMWGPTSAKYGYCLDQSWYFDVIREMMSTPPGKEMMSSSTKNKTRSGKRII